MQVGLLDGISERRGSTHLHKIIFEGIIYKSLKLIKNVDIDEVINDLHRIFVWLSKKLEILTQDDAP